MAPWLFRESNSRAASGDTAAWDATLPLPFGLKRIGAVAGLARDGGRTLSLAARQRK
jgi:hypothetical protein